MTGRRALWILGTVLNRCVLRPEVVNKSQIRDSYGSMLRHHDIPSHTDHDTPPRSAQASLR